MILHETRPCGACPDNLASNAKLRSRTLLRCKVWPAPIEVDLDPGWANWRAIYRIGAAEQARVAIARPAGNLPRFPDGPRRLVSLMPRLVYLTCKTATEQPSAGVNRVGNNSRVLSNPRLGTFDIRSRRQHSLIPRLRLLHGCYNLRIQQTMANTSGGDQLEMILLGQFGQGHGVGTSYGRPGEKATRRYPGHGRDRYS